MRRGCSVLLDTPAGRLYLASDGKGLCALRTAAEGDRETGEADGVLAQAKMQLSAYFAGTIKAFDLPLSLAGTDFERAVWRELCGIPFGEIRSYGQIAERIGRRGAARAVGRACARNPVLLVVPCHRVVASSGALTGFAAGMEMKRRLLAHEGWTIEKDRITG